MANELGLIGEVEVKDVVSSCRLKCPLLKIKIIDEYTNILLIAIFYLLYLLHDHFTRSSTTMNLFFAYTSNLFISMQFTQASDAVGNKTLR